MSTFALFSQITLTVNALSQEQNSRVSMQAQHHLTCSAQTSELAAENRLSRRSQKLRVCDCEFGFLPSSSPTHSISTSPSTRTHSPNSRLSTTSPYEEELTCWTSCWKTHSCSRWWSRTLRCCQMFSSCRWWCSTSWMTSSTWCTALE